MVPSTANSNGTKGVSIQVIDINDGSEIASTFLSSTSVGLSSWFNFIALDYNIATEQLLIGVKGMLSQEIGFIEVIQYNISTSTIEWEWNYKGTFIHNTSANYTSNYVTVVTDSLYFLNIANGNEVVVQPIDYPNYRALKKPVIRCKGNVAYIRIDEVNVCAISLVNFETIWERDNLEFLTPNDITINQNLHINLENGLRKINLQEGSEEMSDIKPYRCSYLETNFSLDKKNKIIYFTDGTRLYALELE